MKFPFRYKGEHNCESAAIFCIDFRFQEETQEWFKKNFGERFDPWTMAGGCQVLADEEISEFAKMWLEKIIKVSCGLHSIKRLALVNHADCGAYGGRKAFGSVAEEKARHLSDLKKAARLLKDFMPAVEVITVYVDLDEKQEIIDISRV